MLLLLATEKQVVFFAAKGGAPPTPTRGAKRIDGIHQPLDRSPGHKDPRVPLRFVLDLQGAVRGLDLRGFLGVGVLATGSSVPRYPRTI